MRDKRGRFIKIDYVHNYYVTVTAKDGNRDWTEVIPKPRWQIIIEAMRDIETLWLPHRFIEQSGNSLDFARL